MTIYERLGNILMARKLEMGLHAHTHMCMDVCRS